MSKSLYWFLAVILIAGMGIWYFLLKENDYSITFKTSIPTTDVYQKLLYFQFEKLEELKTQEKILFQRIAQEALIAENAVDLTWNFTEADDSISLVKLDVKNKDNALTQRWQLLFGQSDQREQMAAEVKRFLTAIEKDRDLYHIEIVGIEESPSATCACINLKNDLGNKAVDMVNHIDELSNFLLERDYKLTAMPRIEVLSWEKETNEITYNFCFPLPDDTLPDPTGNIFVRDIPSRRSLKAIYNGNYMYSHLAWSRSLSYAQQKGLEVDDKILEVFLNNPQLGGDSRTWEAEIYMSLKDQ